MSNVVSRLNKSVVSAVCEARKYRTASDNSVILVSVLPARTISVKVPLVEPAPHLTLEDTKLVRSTMEELKANKRMEGAEIFLFRGKNTGFAVREVEDPTTKSVVTKYVPVLVSGEIQPFSHFEKNVASEKPVEKPAVK